MSSVRYTFTLRIGLSHDSEIRDWPQFRTETKAPKHPVRSFKWGDFAKNQVDYLQIFRDRFYEQVGGAVRIQVLLSAPDTKASNTFDVKE